MVTTPAPYTKTFATILSDFIAAAQAAAQANLDFSEGSSLLALAEATGGNVDWLQKLYLFALSVNRLATSYGNWVDTFCADWMPVVPGTTSPRLPAVAATGLVTFGSTTAQIQAVIPVGTQVATYDRSQVFTVYEDTTNPAWNATIVAGGGYVLPAGQATVNVPVQAVVPGAAGNVLAGTITILQSILIGVDTVTNSAPFINGVNQETDAQLKARFVLYIQSLRGATDEALEYAIMSTQLGLQVKVHNNVDPSGATDNGAVTIYVDDGSGNPPASVVTAAINAVASVRAGGVRVTVLAATTLRANINFSIETAPGYNSTLVIAAVQNAVGAWVNGLGLENPLPWSEIAHQAYAASPGVTNVVNVLLNGGTADLVPAMGQTIKASTVAVG